MLSFDNIMWFCFRPYYMIYDLFDLNLLFSFVLAYDDITHMVDTLGVDGGDRIVKPAVRLYEVSWEELSLLLAICVICKHFTSSKAGSRHL